MNNINILAGKLTGKRPLGKPRRRWVENIRMDLKEIDISTSNSEIQLRIGILESAYECGIEPPGS